MVNIRQYHKSDELNWLDVHASVMVDSSAWWIVLHKKPEYASGKVVDLVAEADGRIIGFISIEVDSEIMKPERDCGFVWEFGVHRDWRGRGVGWQLFTAAHREMLSEFGVRRSIWYSQEPRSQEWYQRVGMKEIDRHMQLSLLPTPEQKEMFKADGFACWRMRGSCAPEDFERIQSKYTVIEDDDTLKPRLCIGYEYIWSGKDENQQ
ncbi:MAG: GNAT family N-acetyltransferase [Firmicutes bacterium]|nr:GNAT family N-acetyltransferase [Bacillota bacterium]